MKLFGVVGEENNKSTREKMPKYDYYVDNLSPLF
jgi:hypothetical protein